MLLTRVKATPSGTFYGFFWARPLSLPPQTNNNHTASPSLSLFSISQLVHTENENHQPRLSLSKLSDYNMEDNSRRETQPALPDLAAREGRRNELTRSHSDSSFVTVDYSKDLIRQSTNARQCTAWTDAKHNSYLDALEASFVKQLHYSLGSLSSRSEQNTFNSIPSQQLPVNASYSSDQFKIIRNGSWQKINFERNQPLLYSAACYHVAVESPQMCNFRCSDSHNTIPSDDSSDCNMFRSEGIPFRGKRIFSHGSTSLEKQCLCHQCHQDAVGGVAEVSDQNFVDKDLEEISTSLSRAKKLKMVKADTSNKDQVVPSEKISTANSPSLREEQVHHKCLMSIGEN